VASILRHARSSGTHSSRSSVPTGDRRGSRAGTRWRSHAGVVCDVVEEVEWSSSGIRVSSQVPVVVTTQGHLSFLEGAVEFWIGFVFEALQVLTAKLLEVFLVSGTTTRTTTTTGRNRSALDRLGLIVWLVVEDGERLARCCFGCE
jgi:hypothetical protein